MRGKSGVMFLFCLLAILSSGRLRAQITSSTLYGQVMDATGAGVPGAQVYVSNTDTNLTRTMETNSLGEYRIELLPVGSYRVEITKAGFKKVVLAGVVLQINVPARVDATMQLGNVSESITVTESVPLINTTSPEIGRTIENEEIKNLPLVNRNAYQLLELTPGVQNSTFNAGQPNPVITLGFPEQRTFINGGVDGGAGSVSYYLDGGINMTGLRNTGNILPNPDAIQEYRVETSNYDAEYGKMSSGVITVLTKSGTNNLHGTLFEYWRDSALNANSWNSALATPPLRRNQFGGTFGGPIIKDKTFFFVSYQGLRQLSSFFFTGATVPTAAERTGDFTAFPSLTALPSQYTCGSPTIICPRLLDPTAQALLNPTGAATTFPTIPTSDVANNGWQGIAPSPFNTDEFLIKLDHNLTANHRLSGSYFNTSGENTVPPLNSTSGQPNGNIPWSIQSYSWRQQNVNASDTWTARPNLINQVWIGYTRNVGGRLNLPATSLGDLGSEFTIQGPHSLPQITVTGFFTAASAIAGPLAESNFYNVRDVVSWNHGRHTISFGADETLDKDIQQTLLNNYGVFGFNGTNIKDSVSGKTIAVPALANFLMGLPTSLSQDSPVTGYTNTWSTGLFAQDNFRIFPRLTINLGLRWDIQTPPTDPLNRGTTFVAGAQSVAYPDAPMGALFFGDPGVTRGIVPVRWHHVSPRIGLAWDPRGDGKTSIRAGAGVFYGSVSGNEWNTVTNFEPSAVRYTFTNATQQVTGSGLTAVPRGATLSCPYNNLVANNGSGAPLGPTVTCTAGAGIGLTGTDPFPFAPGQFITPGGPFFGFAKNFQWPYSYQINLSVQRQLTANLSVSAAYVGTLSHDLPFAQDINAPATGNLAPACATSASGNITQRRPIDNASPTTCTGTGSPFGTLFLAQSNQTASYNGLQTTIQMRMTRGVMLYGFYTFSHTFDSVQLDNNTTQGGAEDMTSLRLERGPADFDIRHQFVTAIVWQLNYFSRESPLKRALLNGWAVSPIIKIHSGLPFTVLNGKDANLSGNTAAERAQIVPGMDPVRGSRNAAEWFNTAAFAQNPAALASGVAVDGNSSRNMLRGPTFKDVDLSISRDFGLSHLRDGMNIQLRADAYNVLNIVSLNSPVGNGATVGSSTFGQITSASAMRQLQLGLRFIF
jgi:Carboxypeptidase regulatory-like domain/TonB dependent receptor